MVGLLGASPSCNRVKSGWTSHKLITTYKQTTICTRIHTYYKLRWLYMHVSRFYISFWWIPANECTPTMNPWMLETYCPGLAVWSHSPSVFTVTTSLKGPVPSLFWAKTLNWYVVSGSKPGTTIHSWPPGTGIETQSCGPKCSLFTLIGCQTWEVNRHTEHVKKVYRQSYRHQDKYK